MTAGHSFPECDEVIIVGSGLNGLLLSLSMATAGCHVRLIDRGEATSFGDNIRTTTINPASYDYLERLGVWSVFNTIGNPLSPIHHIRVSDSQTMPTPGRIVADRLIDWDSDNANAPLAYTFANAQMVASLSALVDAHPHITVTNNAAINGYMPTHASLGNTAASISTEDGQVFSARLIIAADGANSPIRNAAKLRTISRSPGQTAIVAQVKCERPHEQMAWQRFIPGGPAALMPIDQDRMMSLVWTVKDEDAAVLLAADDHGFNTALMESFGTGLGALSVQSERLSWRLNLHHAVTPIATRLVLAGDAAHSIHPLAGQGYNLGVGDAKQLEQTITAAHKAGRDIGSRHVLAGYARSRLAETTAMTAMTDGLNAAFSFGGPIAASLTGMGMTLFGASPLKKLAERVARGR